MELSLPPIYPVKPHRGFAFGNTPWNKGKRQADYIKDEEKLKRMRSNLTPEIRMKGTKKVHELRAKSIICIKDGKIIGEFKSAAEAEDKTNVLASNILACCKKRRITTGGFRWFYGDDYESYDKLLNRAKENYLQEVDKILQYHRLTLAQIRSQNKSQRYSLCRTLIYKYLVEEAGMEYKDVGAYLKRKYNTISQLVNRFNDLLSVRDKTAINAWRAVEEFCITKAKIYATESNLYR